MSLIQACLGAATCLGLASAAKQCAITDFGASPSAKDNAGAITKAVAACAAGGEVTVPAGGAFLTGPLTVTGKGVVLNVARGATLQTALGPADWPRKAGSQDCVDFLTFQDCDGCGLTGEGTLFGQGGRPPAGRDWYYLFDQGKLAGRRPDFVVVSDCVDWSMHGVTLLDAPQFNVALKNVSRAELAHVNITSTWYTDPETGTLMEPHNTDGIDPGDGSSDIHIHDVFIHNGDDSVAVKPSALGHCTRNILVENSHFEHGHGCSIGSVGGGCVENVVFRNITMASQECGCRVKSYSKAAGHVRNITWDTITMEGTAACVQVNANYKPPPADPTHWIDVSDLTFRNIKGRGCRDPPSFECPAASPCTGITLENVDVEGGGSTMKCKNAQGHASGKVSPPSCLTGPTPAPTPTPKPSCDVPGCFARCVAKFGGSIEDQSYYCAKGCAGMSNQKVADTDKFCRVAKASRETTCKADCSSASADPAKQAQCGFGCGFWAQ